MNQKGNGLFTRIRTMSYLNEIDILCNQIPELQPLFKARVRHYNISKHTANVVGQFRLYFADDFKAMSKDRFELFLVVHDIGKSIAHESGNRRNQNLESIKLITNYKDKLGISNEELKIYTALLWHDPIGSFFQGKISLLKASSQISEQSNKSNLEKNDFLHLLTTYYQCDAGSYTKDAGGLKFLEYLFKYENNLKVYNEEENRLLFSSQFEEKYQQLKIQILGIERKENTETTDSQRIIVKKGNIFNSKAQTIVNTVNCVGVMGKGIALVFKLRYPKMFDIYKRYCEEKYIGIGKLWLYDQQRDAPWVLNFPTKFHWKYPSKIEYLEKGLIKFSETYKAKGITSIAFTLLGTHNGGLDKDTVRDLMVKHLSKCDIPIEIYDYDPQAPDDLFEKFKKNWLKLSLNEIKTFTGIQPQYVSRINDILDDPNVTSMVSLLSYKGIGEKTLEKAFNFAINNKQASLF